MRALPHYRDFRRHAAPAQVQQQIIPKTLPAPIRGLTLNENLAFMSPGTAVLLDNWFPTDSAIALRGGTQKWTRLGTVGTPDNRPVQSMFNYIAGANKRMFAANLTSLHDVTSAASFGTPVTPAAPNNIVITNGNFSTAVMATVDGSSYLIAVNDAGEWVLRFNGTTWQQLRPGCTTPPSRITGPGGTPVADGLGLTQVWKYRRRLFFIQGGSMNAWYLDIDAVGGVLAQIPLSGAFTLGGSLLFGCAWSVSAGDGIDDKCIFVTTEGEIAIFTGTNPGDPLNWRQQGRYQISKPLGKNAWVRIGGDVLIATVDGIVPISQALVKDVRQLEFSAISRPIHPMWMNEMAAKNNLPWTMLKWDEYGGLFVTWPGGGPGEYTCGVVNTVTGAWCRFTGWDVMCMTTLSGVMFFGTQKGRIMQADIGGYDTITDIADADVRVPYGARCVFGWEVFGSPPNTFTVRQARIAFNARAVEPFVPQVTCAVDYVYEPLPPLPPIGPDPGIAEVWDQGVWGDDHTLPFPSNPPPEDGMRWDQLAPLLPNTRTSGWISIGETGSSHALIVQVQIDQTAKPAVEILGGSMLAERDGLAV